LLRFLENAGRYLIFQLYLRRMPEVIRRDDEALRASSSLSGHSICGLQIAGSYGFNRNREGLCIT
jgi:hypothetical protein